MERADHPSEVLDCRCRFPSVFLPRGSLSKRPGSRGPADDGLPILSRRWYCRLLGALLPKM